MATGNHKIALVIDLGLVGAGNDEEKGVAVPAGGPWRIEGAKLCPNATSPNDASNNATLTLKKGLGGTALATRTTDVAGGDLTKGTSEDLDLSSAAESALKVDDGDEIYLEKDEAGTGVAVDVTCTILLEQVRA